MRRIKRTAEFDHDLKREVKKHQAKLRGEVAKVVNMLAADKVPPRRCKDHALVREWQDYRDCHIKPDLVLIYRKPDKTNLELIRLGSHRELFEP
jgi:mRNA interferase YafQ